MLIEKFYFFSSFFLLLILLFFFLSSKFSTKKYLSFFFLFFVMSSASVLCHIFFHTLIKQKNFFPFNILVFFFLCNNFFFAVDKITLAQCSKQRKAATNSYKAIRKRKIRLKSIQKRNMITILKLEILYFNYKFKKYAI